MRHFLIAGFISLSIILFHVLRGVTGDGLSAGVLGLVLFVTIAGWFGGRPAASGGQRKW